MGKDGANLIPPEQAQVALDSLPGCKLPDTRELELHGFDELFRELRIGKEQQNDG